MIRYNTNATNQLRNQLSLLINTDLASFFRSRSHHLSKTLCRREWRRKTLERGSREKGGSLITSKDKEKQKQEPEREKSSFLPRVYRFKQTPHTCLFIRMPWSRSQHKDVHIRIAGPKFPLTLLCAFKIKISFASRKGTQEEKILPIITSNKYYP